MSLTHKKLLFAKAYARNPSRREAVVSAGFAESAWARTATRLLTDPEVLAAIERERDRLLKREEIKKMTRADVIGELGEMLVAASDKPGRSGWSARLKVLEVLARVLDKDEAQPGEDVKPVPDDQLRERIAELEAQLGHEEQKKCPTTLSDVPECQPSATDAPEPPQSANTKPVTPQPAINNMMPTDPDERLQQCGRHGEYLSTRRGSRGAWSYCPRCREEWTRDQRWLESLAPAGDGRKIGW